MASLVANVRLIYSILLKYAWKRERLRVFYLALHTFARDGDPLLH
jgi:hypothetical protein